MLKGNTCPLRALLNINIPDTPCEKIKDFMVTRLGKRVYNNKTVERIDPGGGRYYWIGGSNHGFELIEGTDFYALENGYVSVTPLDLDTKNNSSINVLKKCLKWKRLYKNLKQGAEKTVNSKV